MEGRKKLGSDIQILKNTRSLKSSIIYLLRTHVVSAIDLLSFLC